MSTVLAAPSSIRTLADLINYLGGVPLDRIRFRPGASPATVQDVIFVREQEGKLCELVAGVLLEKAVGYAESRLAIWLAGLLNAFVVPRNLGIVTGPDGTVELLADLVRIPDVAVTLWQRFPGRRSPTVPVPQVAPNLAVEVLSRGNAPGEMAAKRRDYFSAGVEIVWEVNPIARTVLVYTSPTLVTTLEMTNTLDGGVVLPGFTLPVRELFVELDRQG